MQVQIKILKQTIQYFIVLLSQSVTFTFFNSVFFIYKYKQVKPMKQDKLCLLHFLLPTFGYYLFKFLLYLDDNIKQKHKNTKLAGFYLILTATYMKILSYFIDNLLKNQSKFACFLLLIQNIFISLVDFSLIQLLDGYYFNKDYKICDYVLFCLILEETPTYFYALFFEYIEDLNLKSLKPYFDLCFVLYIIMCIICFNLSSNDIQLRNINVDKKNESCFDVEAKNTCLYSNYIDNALESKNREVNGKFNYSVNYFENQENFHFDGNHNLDNNNIKNDSLNNTQNELNDFQTCNNSIYNKNTDCNSVKFDDSDNIVSNPELIHIKNYEYLHNFCNTPSTKIDIDFENQYANIKSTHSKKNKTMNIPKNIYNSPLSELKNIIMNKLIRAGRCLTFFNNEYNNKKYDSTEIKNIKFSKHTSNPKHEKLFLFVSRILLTSSDIFIYFFLMSEIEKESYLLLYFSVDFLFKLLQKKPPRSCFHSFVYGKIVLMFFTLFCVTLLKIYTHYIFIISLFALNGFFNRMIYCGFDQTVKNPIAVICDDYIIFIIVSCFVLWYGQKPEQSFEDFIFFSSIRL
ncbi:hypothetical protein EDEG_01930 [Edhazardia aedis USNM 41457]|uniref:Uncharacterized protein n=1 Tax=Edhazardia aedis (strain USNM 41457) TaxID=1003232 RepID=J9D8C9_EDHAE|nr:hypothetical protein EDEG_01930 [Edhazardia aedis USNM 41457]|eukprot:EJW03774.1 hypothetical protein EDEG_01930 [Edhazardia aedis USNM 41457]